MPIPVPTAMRAPLAGRGDTSALKLCNVAFAATFFVVRVGLMWWGIYHLVTVERLTLLAPPLDAPRAIVDTVCGCIVGAGALNAFWCVGVRMHTNEVMRMPMPRGMAHAPAAWACARVYVPAHAPSCTFRHP